MLFDRPDAGDRAVLVHIDLRRDDEREDFNEFKELVLSAGGEPVATVIGHRDSPHPRFFVGTGKLEEVHQAVKDHDAKLVLFNHTLSASQERNIEKELGCRVLDRTGLILDIFAQRARTYEGKLQVELAHLQHTSTRLVGGWSHLERQKGGAGLRGGPGEKQLELDRRMLRVRIQQITRSLEKVRRQRVQGRRSRNRADISSVSLVGYTNAGKSTLFNFLTNSDVYAADQLFATLDPTLRRLIIPDLGPIILADTVGFIRHLPHKLIEAFRATLEEAVEADLLLHVIDCASDDRDANIEQVEHVLKEIGAENIPILEVYNKVDLIDVTPRIDYDANGRPVRVWLSAATGEGTELLERALSESLVDDLVHGRLLLRSEQGALRSAFYKQQVVLAESYSEQGWPELELRMPKSDFCRLVAAAGLDPQQAVSLLQPVH